MEEAAAGPDLRARLLYFTAKWLEINSTGLQAWVWSLDIYSFVFRDSAPKARYQNSLGQAKAGFGP
jgi:hypothetical protein